MGNVAVRVENLGKKYRIGERREAYQTLRDGIANTARGALNSARLVFNRKSAEPAGERMTDFWALRNVSFEIQHGDVVGIIGKNGAGKSTLLKILSRITEPSEGRVRVFGRVGSLLEVGTGFHPELTGRENVFMNGAILGMSKAEITRKFDEIVAFAEVEKFLDTPVKRYSSGMQLRLGFAVAAHFDPEVLIVDEVLAVGDSEFQRKCIGKMEQVAQNGRTVLFVSHNMAAVQHLCPKAMLIGEGRVIDMGHSSGVVQKYLAPEEDPSRNMPGVLFEALRRENRDHQILAVKMQDESGRPLRALHTWDYVKFSIEFESGVRVQPASLDIEVITRDGIKVLHCSTQPDSNVPMEIRVGRDRVECVFPQWPLSAGSYLMSVALAIPNSKWLTPSDDFIPLTVVGRDVFKSGRLVPTASRALVAVQHTWNPMSVQFS
jgi:lipopolysaccharide transport system ATP-binding protein